MKLTQREKIMLILLACIGIIALGYMYIITPELTRLEVLKQENLKIETEVQQVKSIISKSNPINKNLEDALVKTKEKSIGLYPELLQEHLILIIDDIIKKSGLQVDGITFTGIKAGDVPNKQVQTPPMQYQLKDQAKAYIDAEAKGGAKGGSQAPGANAQASPKTVTAAAAAKGQNSLESLGMVLLIKGEYDQIIRFMNEVEALKRAAVIDNITAASGTAGLTGTIGITFYGAAKIPGTDTLFGEWLYKNVYGKENPFK